jgi:hypothetical protein
MSEYCEPPTCEQIMCCEEDGIEITMPQSVKISKLGTKVVVMRCLLLELQVCIRKDGLWEEISQEKTCIYMQMSR